MGDASADLPAEASWNSLLGYYAATQRMDPRGAITEFADRHAQSWLLFETQGRWWADATLDIPVAALSETFPEALSRRNVRTAALGWPLSAFETREGMTFLPALILAAEWSLVGGRLQVRPGSAAPVLNPRWLKEVVSRSRWRESELVEALVPAGEEQDLAAIGERLRHALSSLGAGTLNPGCLSPEISAGSEGLRNAAALFLPDDRSFTRGAAEDLETLRDWTPERRAPTALSALLEGEGAAAPTADAPPLMATGPLTDQQAGAADSALSAPITLIQGPPGTGKSEVILSLVVTTLVSGGSVLFAARNHQALGEVEKRLEALAPDAGLMVRARDGEGVRDTDFLDAMSEIAGAETLDPSQRRGLERKRQEAIAAAATEAAAREAARRRLQLHLDLSEVAEQLARLREVRGDAAAPRPRSLAARILAWLKRFLSRSDAAPAAAETMSEAQALEHFARLQRELDALGPEPAETDNTPHRPPFADLLPTLAPAITLPDEPERLSLHARRRDMEFEGLKARRMSADDARAVLRRRPAWATSTLSVPKRIPLVPALFDLVIFDEASQCDIASALPLLARARRAAIVGDPQQLSFVPSLGLGAERALMDANQIPRQGRASLAQSRNSLFDFAQGRPGVHRAFLPDQFRSAPEIVAWLGDEFYGGRLTGRRDEDGLRAPTGYRPGLAWEHVAGQARRTGDGTENRPEAERVVEILARLAQDAGFEGEVGVVSPVRSQVGLIQKLATERLDAAARARLGELRVATVDRWQGGEADVILFSPVLSPGAPTSLRTFLQRESRRLNVAVSRAKALCLVVGDLEHAKSCGIKHLERLAERASTPWSPPRPPFDSLWERRFHAALSARGLQPIPQYPVGRRFLDFALDPDGAKLDLEVDGRRWHVGPDGSRKVEDRLRDAELTARGWRVMRFWVHDLERDIDGCVRAVQRALEDGRSGGEKRDG